MLKTTDFSQFYMCSRQEEIDFHGNYLNFSEPEIQIYTCTNVKLTELYIILYIFRKFKLIFKITKCDPFSGQRSGSVFLKSKFKHSSRRM